MAIVVLDGPMMSERTSLRCGGKTIAELILERPEDAHDLEAALEEYGGRPLTLGRGSNILAADGQLGLVVVSLPRQGKELITRETLSGKVRVRVAGGVGLQKVIAWCLRHGLSGLEGLAGIPGSVGGAVAQNAGSYGCEMAGVLTGLVVWSPESGLRRIVPGEYTTGYRSFALRDRAEFFIVFEAELELSKTSPEAAMRAFTEAIEKKKASQPLDKPTAGCIFKNPQGESAGKLMDRAGLKGLRKGDMAFSELHANFMVNLGRGTASQAAELIAAAREAVKGACGLELELEVRTVG
ncbi:MAG: UDP-N-acetylmuramate dehydrogenase [Desulfovibrionaceae bacterium]|nr:UDP-N-acetylmuramate dehydrogenase [Desulfovibrionaceae bacterium]MBF0514467.1 UDP-N-acetylmuramate dehydrogenase [Desulfovibrionaceae bacterium]